MSCDSLTSAINNSIRDDPTIPVSQYDTVIINIENSTISNSTITIDQQNQLINNLSQQTISDFTDPIVQGHIVSAVTAIDPALEEEYVQKDVRRTIGIIFQENAIVISFDMAHITNLDLYVQQYNLQQSVVSSITNQFCTPPKPTMPPTPLPTAGSQWIFYTCFLTVFFIIILIFILQHQSKKKI